HGSDEADPAAPGGDPRGRGLAGSPAVPPTSDRAGAERHRRERRIRMNTHKRSVSRYLKSLGETPGEIAAAMRALGIRGVQRSPRQCIIVKAVYANCDPWPGLCVYGGPEGSSYRATYNDAQILDPQLPAAVGEFVAAFDRGDYRPRRGKEIVVSEI